MLLCHGNTITQTPETIELPLMWNDNGAPSQQSERASFLEGEQKNTEGTKEIYEVVAFPNTASDDIHEIKDCIWSGVMIWYLELAKDQAGKEDLQMTVLVRLSAANFWQIIHMWNNLPDTTNILDFTNACFPLSAFIANPHCTSQMQARRQLPQASIALQTQCNRMT